MRVVFATPTYTRPFDAYLAALEASVPELDAAGIEHGTTFVTGSSYISWARAALAAKFMASDYDQLVYLDHDLSWSPRDLVRLLEPPGDVVAGLYRFKEDAENYMGALEGDGAQVIRSDGCIAAVAVPAGFLRISRAAIERFREAYPELIFGPDNSYIDLFNHGAHEGKWWGEDYAFCRRWRAIGGEIWVIPDLSLTHHTTEKAYPGNYHEFLMHRPGGRKYVEAA